VIKFVVNGANRTGTHFLQSLLNDHPDINCYWDIFWQNDVTPIGYAAYRKQFGNDFRFSIFARHKVLNGFLDSHFAKPVGVEAAGFLLKSETAANTPAILKWFQKNEVKVIHLVRENHLMRIIAFELRRQKIMVGHARDPVKFTKICIDAETLLSRIEYAERELIRHYKRLVGIDVLEVKYELLIKEQDEELGRIFNFLKVQKMLDIKSEFYKTEQESPRAMIENYDEVFARLEGTRFSSFLDE